MFIKNTLSFLDHHEADGCHEDDNKDDDEWQQTRLMMLDIWRESGLKMNAQH